MLISSLAHTAQVVSSDADPRFYDDIGCLAKDRAAHRAGARLYVQSGDEWLLADAARYVFDESAHSPMGYNVVAITDDKIEAQLGRVLTWTELVQEMERR
ncbi:MAG: hypothetical protein HYX76_07940 [Acidobacteria bacterium]|nr:hypothetical protein [Acidobacteriota bacterium]